MRADGAIVDTAFASALNFLSAFVIGVLYGVSTLGEFSLILIYSSFVYLFAYNFIIVPATSKPWSISDYRFAQKVMVISLFSFVPLACSILAFDHIVLNFSNQSMFLSFVYIVSHNAFLTLRRVVLHLGLAKYPTLIPLVVLVAVSIPAAIGVVSYTAFLLTYSLSFFVAIAHTVFRRPERTLLPDIALAVDFLRFSRWMTFGIWFQWLSGNLVQLLVQHHSGAEALGTLRVLLSSFGFLSIYFQYQEIVLARAHRGETNPRFTLSSALDLESYVLPSMLILLCLPIYLVYCHMVGTTPLWTAAIIYSVYQFLVFASIIMRVYLRLMGDLQFAMFGYIGMVITVVSVELMNAHALDLMNATIMYLASMSVMVMVLAVGLLKTAKRRA
ncbi:hypothetical protein GTA62_15585 [Roseobacter sp. HKCCD9010]|nr:MULTISPECIES: hypothetical protein [unclassified Roseobacter]MBF9050473.1 hypothetical protein [Rhodobacterales bacterium HKCCD4356]NNV39131.1 hypothetical protein [Roseobacter sp. HKCCD9054]NNV77026.1 hypothetical protein [Roseobacter sp. HKCCD6135]NNW24517.1 hypothetical protein [Roseobacter sp. HKCCD5929]NNW33102.1 hypothetical protein [Roseobacter sp. HKCCD8198]NNW49947.1 hypothetical protein [Roseobacter sp. HKCCD9144]NNW54109.1 hypothetical protein [Roseobacter sp. HKCCD8284]NNW585